MIRHHHRRVVVTGIGAITPLGPDAVTSFQSLTNSGITSLRDALSLQNLTPSQLESELTLIESLPSQIAASCRIPPHSNRTSRTTQFVLQAAEESLSQSGLLPLLQNPSSDNVRRHRIGTCIGTGMPSPRTLALASQTPLRRLSPHFIPSILPNTPSSRLSIEYNLRGPNLSPTTACAAGAHAIGDAVRLIRNDTVDVMLAGGGESCIDPLSLGGFSRLRALSTGFNDVPEEASRPFDEKRDGFVMGEGAGVLLLEELEHAKKRGVVDGMILAECVGYGCSGDGWHVTAPDPEGRGAERAMRMALKEAGEKRVDYVNAHATSTPLGDEIEERAIERVMQSMDENDGDVVWVSSTKGATGHLLGAAGAVEAIFSIMTLMTGPVRHVTGQWLESDVQTVMSNSFGFGGTNACLMFSKWQG